MKLVDSLSRYFSLDCRTSPESIVGSIREDRSAFGATLVLGDIEVPYKIRPPEKCAACGRPQRIPNYENASAQVAGAAREWPSCLYDGEVIVSEDVIEDLRAHGRLDDLVPHPLRLVLGETGLAHLNLRDAPQYYWCEFKKKVELDRGLFDGFDGKYCETCGHWSMRAKNEGRKFTYGEKCTVLHPSESGDFWTARNFGRYHFCSRAVIEIARKSGWSGFWFRGLLPGIKLELEHDDWCERYIEQARSRYSKLFEPGMPLSEDGKNQTMPGEHSDLADILLEAIYAK